MEVYAVKGVQQLDYYLKVYVEEGTDKAELYKATSGKTKVTAKKVTDKMSAEICYHTGIILDVLDAAFRIVGRIVSNLVAGRAGEISHTERRGVGL